MSRTFLELALADLNIALQTEESVASTPGDYFLVPLDGRLLGPGGVDPLARHELTPRMPRSQHALEVSAHGFGVRTLALMRDSGTSIELVSVIDGWLLIRRHGQHADLAGIDLRGAFLESAQLQEADLAGANLAGSWLEGANLARADLRGADLSGATLRRASLWGADVSEADVRRADLRHTDLREIKCRRTAFRGSDMWSAYVWDVSFEEAFTDGTEIERADYRGTILPKPKDART